MPPRTDFLELVEALVTRRTRILFVYPGALSVRNNEQDQLFEAFPSLRGKVEIAYFPNANPVFTLDTERQLLVEWISAWARSPLLDRAGSGISAAEPRNALQS